MRNGNKFTMNTPNTTETLGDLLSQLGGILGVGRRSDGKFYLADMCTASSIKKWAMYKPIEHETQANLTDALRKAANQGFNLQWWYDLASMVSYVRQNNASWEYKDIVSWKRLRDFNGYNHAMTMTPYKLIQSTAEEGIAQYVWQSSDNYNKERTPLACNFTHKAEAEIQPTDLALFGTGYTYIYGVIACNQNWGDATLYTLYKSLSSGLNQSGSDTHAVTMNPNSDIRWRYSANSAYTSNPAYFSIPANSNTQSNTMKFIPCIIRMSGSSQAGILPLPTERIMEFRTFNPTADVMTMWARSTSPKPLRIYKASGNSQLINSFRVRLSFLDLEKFTDAGLDFEIGYEVRYNGNEMSTMGRKITPSNFNDYVVSKTSAGNDQYLYTLEVFLQGDTGNAGGLPIINSDVREFAIDVYIAFDVKGGDAAQNKVYQNLAGEKQGPSANFPLVLQTQAKNPFVSKVSDIMTLLTSTYYSIESL